MGGSKLLPPVYAAVLVTKPFAVYELRPGEVNGDAASGEPLDRLTVESLGGLPIAQKRLRPGPKTKRQVRAARECPLLELTQGVGCDRAVVASGPGLDELGQGPAEETEVLVRACALRRGKGLRVATQAAIQDSCRVGSQTIRG